MNKRGFTLIELMIVIAIIGILSAIIIPVFLDSKNGGLTLEQKQKIIDTSLQLKKAVKQEIVSVIVDVETELESRKKIPKISEPLTEEVKKSEATTKKQDVDNYYNQSDDFDYSSDY